MNLVRRLFPFRTCTIDIKDGERALQRPCLLYHIKRCQGPCIEAISKDDYRADIEQVELFLEGRQETLVKALRREMRGRVGPAGLRACREPPRQDPGDRADDGEPEDGGVRPDGAGPGRPRARGQPGRGQAVRHPRRQGDRAGRVPPRCRPRGVRRPRSSRASCSSTTRARPRSRARSTYRRRSRRPTSSQTFLVEKRGGPVHLLVRRSVVRSGSCSARGRGTRRRRSRASRLDGSPTRARRSPHSRSSLTPSALPGTPFRIECYDISNFQGSESVGSMVVFEDGKPRTGEYRRFRVRTVEGPERRREPPGGPASAVPGDQVRRGGQRGGAPLGDARPRHHRRWEAAR